MTKKAKKPSSKKVAAKKTTTKKVVAKKTRKTPVQKTVTKKTAPKKKPVANPEVVALKNQRRDLLSQGIAPKHKYITRLDARIDALLNPAD
jgi:hypothetical protein